MPAFAGMTVTTIHPYPRQRVSIIEELFTFNHFIARETLFFSLVSRGGGESLRMSEPVTSLLKASEDEKTPLLPVVAYFCDNRA